MVQVQRRRWARLGWRAGNGMGRCLRAVPLSTAVVLIFPTLLDALLTTSGALFFAAAVGSVALVAHDVVLRGRECRHDEEARLAPAALPVKSFAAFRF